MELPPRTKGDGLLRPGALLELRARLRKLRAQHDLTSVIACAYDPRTRMLPFVYAAKRMAPAGARAIGAAMADAGFNRTRIVLGQWNRNFRPSEMRLEGCMPDLFMVSSMTIHSAACDALIRDACLIDQSARPLIIAGGPKAIYEPWAMFSADATRPAGADVVVTGEEYVLLSLVEVLLSCRRPGEAMRVAFQRARDGGMLDEIPGLVYPRVNDAGVTEELVDTGIQRLLVDLDETPHPALGYRLLERPSRNATLASSALPDSEIRKYSPIGALVLTLGCAFSCPYCPIPAYNQRTLRAKSGLRVADEFVTLHKAFGLRNFFGTDDNFFSDKKRALDIVDTLSGIQIEGVPLRKRIRWGTEVTVHDTLKFQEHLPAVRKAGVRMLWLGVEDMTATLIKKGQSVDKTTTAFRVLNKNGICPMPMLMHHDDQPLVSRGAKPYGLLNQVRLLRKAGAISMQVLMLVPATGSKLYEDTYTSGMVYERVGSRAVESHMFSGNYVMASHHAKPWRKQLNIMIAYVYFYNPLRLVWALVRPKSSMYIVDAGAQSFGMWGLVHTLRRTLGWAWRLRRGTIKRQAFLPVSRIPMCSPLGAVADHALPGTPMLSKVRVTPNAGHACCRSAAAAMNGA